VNIIVRRMVSLRSVLLTYGQTVEQEASLLNLGGPRFAFRSSARTVHIEITPEFLGLFHAWNRRVVAHGIVRCTGRGWCRWSLYKQAGRSAQPTATHRLRRHKMVII